MASLEQILTLGVWSLVAVVFIYFQSLALKQRRSMTRTKIIPTHNIIMIRSIFTGRKLRNALSAVEEICQSSHCETGNE